MPGFGPAAEAACIVRSEGRNLCAAKGHKTNNAPPALIDWANAGLGVGGPPRCAQTRPAD
jgi:hypothetical protein